ncbi:hypothetical protein BV898_10337 [Hypsibius exemplaris]|uniref:Metaxin-1 n=1 Tax=Hypsibius exemplaris TaxID=2072580 RepID=A0A1W0WJX2_HYPEX|nr:hypothetical protein BV898_10337 [Hypsibius exemplaris]
MSSVERFQLVGWKGGWTLPSVDPECLRAIVFVALSKSPVDVMLNTSPWNAPESVYPFLCGPSPKSIKSGAENIIKYLKTQGFECCHDSTHITPYEEADAYALESYTKSSLAALLDYLWWADEDFFRRVSQPWYAKDSTLFGKFVWVHYQRRRVMARLFTTPDTQLSVDKMEIIRRKIVQKAKQCLEDLSVKLSDKTFIFGLQPSALDATIFSYLAPLFYIPWKNKDVRQELFMDSLDKFKNLKSYVDRIRKRYLDGTNLSVQTVRRPVRWYDPIVNRIQKHRDTLIFIAFAGAVNLYLLRRTIGRLRFNWPAFNNHSRQRSQEYIEMAKNLGLDPPSTPNL